MLRVETRRAFEWSCANIIDSYSLSITIHIVACKKGLFCACANEANRVCMKAEERFSKIFTEMDLT